MRFVTFALALPCVGRLYGQPTIQQNLDVENNNSFESFSMLDDTVHGFTLFIVGENHRYKSSNHDLQLKMFRYLYYEANVRHLILERGYSTGYLINNYVQSGDTAALSLLQGYSDPEVIEFCRNLRNWNDTLPEEQKITVHGIDIEPSYSVVIGLMSELLPKRDAPDSIRLAVESIRSLAQYIKSSYSSLIFSHEPGAGYDVEESLAEILKNYHEFEEQFETYVGDDYPLFKRLMAGAEVGHTFANYRDAEMIQAWLYRENQIFSNFMEVFRANPGVKFFGQFGRCHAFLEERDPNPCGWYAFQAFASRVDRSSEVALHGRVLPIAQFYKASDRFELGGVSDLIDLADPDSMTLFNVRAHRSSVGELDTLFPFIIINPSSNIDAPVMDLYGGSHYLGVNTHADFSYGLFYPNLSALNSHTILQGFGAFNTPMITYSGAISVHDKDFTTTGNFHLNVFKSQPRRNNDDSSTVSLSGFTAGVRVGGDVFAGDVLYSKWITVAPMIGLSYGQLTLLVAEDSTASTSFFNSTSHTTYRNPAGLLELMLDARVTLAFVSMGVKTGYQFDLSNGNWRENWTLLRETPKTSMRGFWIQANVSLYVNY